MDDKDDAPVAIMLILMLMFAVMCFIIAPLMLQ
jgi:hypothetical protein